MKQAISIKEYQTQQQACDSLCDVTETVVVEADLMQCVTCPFCRELVNAILTPQTISCPACKVMVDRS